jgi:hypothetical protein
LSAGAVNFTFSDPGAVRATVGFAGARGLPATIVGLVADLGPVPNEFLPATRNEYFFPFLRPGISTAFWLELTVRVAWAVPAR